MKYPDREFWKVKKVFITGATGFKGSWLKCWMIKLGANVKTNSNLDICDKETVLDMLYSFKPEIVFHLAAKSTVQEAFSDPIETIRSNTLGTITILEVLKKLNCAKAIINVTTDKVYYTQDIERGYTEGDTLGGNEIYSISKVCSEYISRVYRWTYKLPVASVRAGNVIGGGDFKESRLIPNYYNAYLSGEKLSIIKDAVRPWQYVLDALCGYILLAEKLYENSSYVGAWNFSSNEYEAKTVQWIVDEMNRYFTPKVEYEFVNDRGYYETKLLRLSSKKAITALNWEPIYSMEEMIKDTATWYFGYFGNSALSLMNTFIEKYEDRYA